MVYLLIVICCQDSLFLRSKSQGSGGLDQTVYYSWQIYSYLFVGKICCSYGQNRKEHIVLTRCCTGHGRFTHRYLLNNEERPECNSCGHAFFFIMDKSIRTLSILPIYFIQSYTFSNYLEVNSIQNYAFAYQHLKNPISTNQMSEGEIIHENYNPDA